MWSKIGSIGGDLCQFKKRLRAKTKWPRIGEWIKIVNWSSDIPFTIRFATISQWPAFSKFRHLPKLPNKLINNTQSHTRYALFKEIWQGLFLSHCRFYAVWQIFRLPKAEDIIYTCGGIKYCSEIQNKYSVVALLSHLTCQQRTKALKPFTTMT